jgi:hypothetical protein
VKREAACSLQLHFCTIFYCCVLSQLYFIAPELDLNAVEVVVKGGQASREPTHEALIQQRKCYSSWFITTLAIQISAVCVCEWQLSSALWVQVEECNAIDTANMMYAFVAMEYDPGLLILDSIAWHVNNRYQEYGPVEMAQVRKGSSSLHHSVSAEAIITSSSQIVAEIILPDHQTLQ